MRPSDARGTIDVAAVRARLADPMHVVTVLGLGDGATSQPRGVMIRCPAHADRTPSCSVRVADDGTIACHCFACAWGGDVIDLIATVEDIEPRTRAALVRAAELAGVSVTTRVYVTPRPRPRPTAPTDDGADLALTIGAVVVDVEDDDEVATYLDRRGILDVARDDDWGALDTEAVQYALAERIAMGGDPVDMVRAGLVRGCDDGYRMAWQHHRIVIPWRRRDGTVQTVQRRRIGHDQPRYVFPRGGRPRQPYGVHRLRDGAPLAIVEGAVDAIALRALDARAGVERLAVGVPGTGGWDDAWSSLLAGRHIYVAADADDAGEGAAASWAVHAWRAGATGVERMRPVGGADWGAVVGAAA